MSEDRDILAARKAKLEAWVKRTGGYRNDFRRQHTAGQLHGDCADKDKSQLQAEGITTSVCGRIMLRRVMGKASFITLQDVSGRNQCYLTKNDLDLKSVFPAFS